MTNNKVLISTIKPISGGVPQKLRYVLAWLKKGGYDVTVAYYEPYSLSPKASIPFKRIGSVFGLGAGVREPQLVPDEFEGVKTVGVGCWLPELEFSHYWLSKRWNTLIDNHDFHLCVSGSNLAALSFAQRQKPFMAWLASPWREDRVDRVKQFSWYRRVFDSLIVSPVCRIKERKINQSGTLMPVSSYSQRAFINDGASPDTQVFHVPVDANFFTPVDTTTSNSTLQLDNEQTQTIGFVGRFEDPRKNISLLIKSFADCLKEKQNLRLLLIGDEFSPQTRDLIDQLGISEKIEARHGLSRDELLNAIREMSVFVVPSFQEGLCIAALEAMSCGVPIISTRCGGPEDFIYDQKNGLLVDFDQAEMTQKITLLLNDKSISEKYSLNARQTILDHFSIEQAERHFWDNFAKVYSVKQHQNK